MRNTRSMFSWCGLLDSNTAGSLLSAVASAEAYAKPRVQDAHFNIRTSRKHAPPGSWRRSHFAYLVLGCLLAVHCCEAQQQLPTWRTHYLLANASVQLEPCSANQLPRAWLPSRVERQGTAQLPGTAEMQRIIYDHQHPSDCSNVTFLVFRHPTHLGLGAMVDYLADALGFAMAEGRVLLLDYQSPWTRWCTHVLVCWCNHHHSKTTSKQYLHMVTTMQTTSSMHTH